MNNLGLLATKVGMTQLFVQDGIKVPVTVLKVAENIVIDKKEKDNCGYESLVVGYGDIKEKNVNKAQKGKFSDLPVKRFLREMRIHDSSLADYKIGDKLGMEVLKEASSIDVTSTSKGKGYAGVMKRHNMHGFRATHGTHEMFRHGGSIGCRAQPGKVFKGKKMAGQMGNERVSVLNLRIVKFIEDDNLICVRGAVPGAKGALIEIKASSRRAKPLGDMSDSKLQVQSKNPMKASKASSKK